MKELCTQRGRRLAEDELAINSTLRDLEGHGRWLQEDLISACRSANLNLLRIGNWNMCRNIEWMFCAISGSLAPGAHGSLNGGGEIIFSLAPKELDVVPFCRGTYFRAMGGTYAENDIYYLEVCVLSAICSNRNELFQANRGSLFRCRFDKAGYAKLQQQLLQWG